MDAQKNQSTRRARHAKFKSGRVVTHKNTCQKISQAFTCFGQAPLSRITEVILQTQALASTVTAAHYNFKKIKFSPFSLKFVPRRWRSGFLPKRLYRLNTLPLEEASGEVKGHTSVTREKTVVQRQKNEIFHGS